MAAAGPFEIEKWICDCESRARTVIPLQRFSLSPFYVPLAAHMVDSLACFTAKKKITIHDLVHQPVSLLQLSRLAGNGPVHAIRCSDALLFAGGMNYYDPFASIHEEGSDNYRATLG